tara:strand:- start:52 stop:201 length:150 start_codon:yes stop_codon:yes gene_type:complete
MPNSKTRVVITIDTGLRDEIKKLAKQQGKVLSAMYVDLFKKGHEIISQG